MGGAVSSGRDNNELIDNLLAGNYIRTATVERVFRAVDRADYMLSQARDQAYKDLAWKTGPLHLSAPCIYSEVMEGLELCEGLTFLNVGSGTGYLSTMVGLVLGTRGVNHGVEVHRVVLEYANKKLKNFIENSPVVDDMDFCEPKFFFGNGLSLHPLQATYDRVYCGAECPEEYLNYFKQLVKVGGIVVMPLNDSLVQLKRVSESEWCSRDLLQVSFTSLRQPIAGAPCDALQLELSPASLQALSRAAVRNTLRAALQARRPELLAPPAARPRPRPAAPRRICIPVDDDSDIELNTLHDLDTDAGANEMNALLSLVLSMGQNRVAGSLRLDHWEGSDSEHYSSTDFGSDTDTDDDDNNGDQSHLVSSSTDAYNADSTSDGNANELPSACYFIDTDDATASLDIDSRRQKLDSGIGEDVSPAASTSSSKTESRVFHGPEEDKPPSSQTDAEVKHKTESEVCRSAVVRAAKRSHRRSSDGGTESSGEEGGGGAGGGAGGQRRYKRRASCERARHAEDVRRDRLASAMRAAVYALPLPLPLRRYLNYGRYLRA